MKISEINQIYVIFCEKHFHTLHNLLNPLEMDQLLMSAAKQLEHQLDSEIEKLDNLTVDDIDSIRERRLKEMKARQEKIVIWKTNVRKRRL